MAAVATFIRTGALPEWANKPSLSGSLKYLGEVLLAVTGLDACTEVFD